VHTLLRRQASAEQPFWDPACDIIDLGQKPAFDAVIHMVINNSDVKGPVNLVSPYPVTNSRFTQTLGRSLRRPTPFPFPARLARLVLGEMADALLLASTRVKPQKLQDAGYAFRHPDLDSALQSLVGS